MAKQGKKHKKEKSKQRQKWQQVLDKTITRFNKNGGSWDSGFPPVVEFNGKVNYEG